MFRVTVGHASDRTIELYVVGELVLGEATKQLRDVLSSLATTYAEVVVDFTTLTRIDSAGTGLLVACYSAAPTRGSKLRITNVTGRVREVLLLVKLLTILDDSGTPLAA
jgi:anti-anti-sigma factor